MPTRTRRLRTLLAAIAVTAAGATLAAGRLETGADLARACPADDATLARQCDEAIMSVIFPMITERPRDNPFHDCPIDITRAKRLQDRLDGLRGAVSEWIKKHPAEERARADTVIRHAVEGTEVCRL